MDSNIKLSNVIGAPFQQYVLDQFYLRAAKNSTTTRTLDQVLFIANKTAWARLVSSVDVIGRQVTVDKDGKQELTNVVMADTYKALGVDYKEGADLAKNWILEAGTSRQVGNGIELKYGVSASNAEGFTNTVNSSYGLGGTTELGFVPMPGLTSITVETLGRLGSLRQANINFRVNNLNQLNVIEALYFRLGYSMILEWGHTQYYKNNNDFVANGIYGIGDPFKNTLRMAQIIQQINQKTREVNGNYGGMCGIVTGFNWSATQDGGYECTLKLIGRGAIMDSLKVNQSYALPPGDIKEYKNQNQLLEEETARQKALYERDQHNQGSGEPVVDDTLPPPANIDDLYQKIKALIDPNDTFVDFVHKYGTGISSKETFDPKYIDPESGITKFTFQDYEEKDFLIATGQFDNVTNQGLKQRLKKYYGGVFVSQGINLYHLTGANISAQLDVNENNRIIRYFAEYDFVTDGFEQFPLKNTIQGIDLILQFKRNIHVKSYIGTIILNLGSVTPSNYDWRDVSTTEMISLKMISRVKGPALWLGNANEDNQSTIYDPVYHLPYSIYGKHDTSFFEVAYETTWNSFKPTPLQVALALDALIDQNGGSNIPVQNITFSYEAATGADTYDKPDFKTRGILTGEIYVTVPLVKYTGPNNEAIGVYKDPNYAGQFGDLYEALGISYFFKKELQVKITIKTTELHGFSHWTQNGTPIPGTLPTEVQEESTSDEKEVSKVDTSTQKSPEGFSSALQAMLTIVQTYAQSQALYDTGVVYVDISEITKKFYDNGALAGTIVIDAKAGLTGVVKPKLDAVKRGEFDLLSYALVGFNATAMADRDQYENIPQMNYYRDLTQAYVFKYKMPGLEGVLGSVRSPTYISLGYLLAFLNNMCLIYDTNQTKEFGITSSPGTKLPYIFIDCNPNTNFCFTNPQQFSIDPTICMISMQATQDEYATIFPGGSKGEIAINLDPKLFNPQENNIVNAIAEAFPFKAGDKDGQPNRGSIMNIMLNCQYLLDLCTQMSQNDPEQAVNLKPFLDQIMVDVNKSLGGINSFRVAYVDESNVVQIVDDQWVPSPNGLITKQASALDSKEVEAKKAEDIKKSGQLPSDNTLIPSADAPGQLVLIGTKSITRDLRFNTLISSKLASKIAISAQAEVGAVNDKDHSPYSHLNTFYEDRYSRSKEDPSKAAANAEKGDTKTKERSTDQQAADLFNGHVIGVYSDFNAYSPNNIQLAKNYYLGVMAKVKAENPLTTANPYVSLELEMTVDGISGIVMGNAFTVPNDRLPYTFRGPNNTTKIAFIVTGLVHTIQSNEWLTKIKGQMIKLKKAVVVGAAIAQISKDQKAFVISNITGGVSRKNCGDKKYSGAKQVPEDESVNSQNFSTVYYPGFKFVKGTSDINLDNKKIPAITEDKQITDDTTRNKFNIGKNPSTPTTFVIHHTGGNNDDPASTVYSTFYCSGHPAHYVVESDGKIHRFLPDGAKGWHAQDHNTGAIGVEVIAENEASITEAQKQAVARLAQYLGFSKSQLRYHGQYENRMNDEGTVIYNYIINNL